MDLNLSDRRMRRDKLVRVSEPTLMLIKQQKDKLKEITGKDLAYDVVIKLALDKPSAIVIQQNNGKKKIFKSVFNQELDDMNGYSGY
ncbi:MAG: hypothetical protein QW478_08875 [Candidatus Micrarchaeaceae archaeon]